MGIGMPTSVLSLITDKSTHSLVKGQRHLVQRLYSTTRIAKNRYSCETIINNYYKRLLGSFIYSRNHLTLMGVKRMLLIFGRLVMCPAKTTPALLISVS